MSRFLMNWEDLTIGWAPSVKVRKIPLYCGNLVGKYIRTLTTYNQVNRRTEAEFQSSMMTEFKEEDDEQMRYTDVYLQKAAFDTIG